MFYPSSKHHFDTMFVILCVVAGATIHIISSTSKAYANQPSNDYRASFIDLISDSSLTNRLYSQNSTIKDSAELHFTDYNSNVPGLNQHFVCALLSNLLPADRSRFCEKHQNMIATILPQIFRLTKEGCLKITSDLRWNCTTIDLLLDRSSPLAYTREAALVRSILNASMMYLVLKACISGSYHSCGCREDIYMLPFDRKSNKFPLTTAAAADSEIREPIVDKIIPSRLLDRPITASEIDHLNSGSPLRLADSNSHHQGCRANIGFAHAFTKVFIDSEDVTALNKAYKTLNENNRKPKTKSPFIKRLAYTENKDLAYIKWSKSAINLHNNNLGRQFMANSVQKRCRCHGLSGACQFQTCWDHLIDFDLIAFRIREVYLSNSSKVEVVNIGSFDQPDLRIRRTVSAVLRNRVSDALDDTKMVYSREEQARAYNLENREVGSRELIYLFESPDYCETQPPGQHFGTKGRACVHNITTIQETSKNSPNSADSSGVIYAESQRANQSNLGSCEYLCCNRGHRTELVLHIAKCNCKFEFCCRVKCDQCIRQKIEHYCL